jgi:hypothetical protein
VKKIGRVIIALCLLSACTAEEAPHTSTRCRRFIEADAEARAAWEQARDSGAPEDEIRRLRIEFGFRHDALFDSGCLVS